MSAIAAVALVGPRAAGKTTVGRELAQRLGWAWIDADERLAAAAGRPVGELLRAVGEPEFRRREAAVTVPLLAAAEHAVVALGGGAVVTPAVRAALQRPGLHVVLLIAPVEALAARIAAAPTDRPALTDLPLRDEVEALLRARRPWYEAVAHCRFDTAQQPAPAIAAAIAAAIGR